MPKKISKADRELIAAHRIGAIIRGIVPVDRVLNILTNDENVKNVLAGNAVMRVLDAISVNNGSNKADNRHK